MSITSYSALRMRCGEQQEQVCIRLSGEEGLYSYRKTERVLREGEIMNGRSRIHKTKENWNGARVDVFASGEVKGKPSAESPKQL